VRVETPDIALPDEEKQKKVFNIINKGFPTQGHITDYPTF